MDDFQNNIRQWVAFDNRIKSVNEELRTLRQNRNQKASDIIMYASANRMSNATVNITDGKLKFITSNQTAPLTLKHVENCLKKCMSDETQVDAVMNFIKNTRPTKVTSDIKRTYSSN